jgi:uncharacterized membrane protein
MTRRSGAASGTDRLWACLPYALPIAQSLIFGMALIALLPGASLLMLPLMLIGGTYMKIVGSIPFGDLVIFFVLYLAVVRNPGISHFIRFHTMQALMIGICMSLVSIFFQLVMTSGSLLSLSEMILTNPLVQWISAAAFIFAAACYCYSIFCAAQGKYAEIRMISDAAYAQTDIV